MAKILTSLLAGISVFLASFNHYFIKVDEIVIKASDAIYYKYQDGYKLTYQDITIYESDQKADLSFCLVDNYIYVLFKDEDYYLAKYSLGGNRLEVINITNIYSSLKIVSYNHQLLIYGGIDIDLLTSKSNEEDNNLSSYDLELLSLVKDIDHYQLDGFIGYLNNNLKISSIDIYKGSENESIGEIYIFNNDLYLCGTKGINSSGIYGNGGGSYFLLRLEEQIKFRQIFKEAIKQVKMINDNIYLSTSKDIYLFDSDNSLILGLNLGLESDFIYLCDNYLCLAICQDKGYLVSGMSSKILYEFDLSGYDFYGCSDYLYFLKEEKGYILDIVNISNYLDTVYSKYYNQVELLDGLYGKYLLTDTSYDHHYEKIVYGKYLATYNYRFNDLKISLEGKVIVLEEENVIDGMIYPLGYHLFFNGVGYLNGVAIYQNHEISAPGEYILRLEGIDKVKEIKFYVSEEQVSFSDNLMSDYDLYSLINSKIKIKIDCKEICQVLVNDKYIDVFKENEDYYIYLDIKNTDNGFLIRHGVDLDGIVYPIGYFIRVLGINEAALSLSEDIKKSEEVSIDINIYQGGDALRCLILEVDGNEYYYPLGESEIRLDENYTGLAFNLYFGVSNGTKVYDKVKIFSGIVNGSNLSETRIIQKGEYIEAIRFSINNKGVSIVEAREAYIELKENHDYKMIITSFILGIIIFILIMIIRYKRRFKKIK